jgi:hypothetical protein
VEKTEVLGEKHILSQVTDQLYHIMLYLAKEKGQTMIYLTPLCCLSFDLRLLITAFGIFKLLFRTAYY